MLFFGESLENNTKNSNDIFQTTPICASDAKKSTEMYWLKKSTASKDLNMIFNAIHLAINSGENSCTYFSNSCISHNAIDYLRSLGYICQLKNENFECDIRW